LNPTINNPSVWHTGGGGTPTSPVGAGGRGGLVTTTTSTTPYTGYVYPNTPTITTSPNTLYPVTSPITNGFDVNDAMRIAREQMEIILEEEKLWNS